MSILTRAEGEKPLPKNILLLLTSISTLLMAAFLSAGLGNPTQSAALTDLESQFVAKVNGTNAYNFDLELERIAFNHSLSKYSFRSAGSSGANATADWIVEQFESFGLETYKEPYQFTNWDVQTKPTLLIDEDGNFTTTTDQTIIDSFQSVHYSWPTPLGGAFGDLVVLPLPPAANIGQIGMNPINMTAWNAIDTTGKIVLVGREVRWAYFWESTFKGKLTTQTPRTVVYTWWYDWMSWVPPLLSSAGGRPGSTFGPYFWDLGIPAGFVNYEDGLLIRTAENSLNVSARAEIDAVISTGLQFNIVGKLMGRVSPDKVVIVCAHRDTVMTSGFCDNGAGTAGVIELARVFSEANRTGLLQPRYTILFILFDGEELGLVGSVNYVMQHKSEMDDIVAIINTDVPGSDYLDVSATDPDPATGLDLDELVLKAAEDLGTYAEALEDHGGSDDIPFIDPATGEWFYSFFWNLSAGIEDANPVESSLTIASHPTFYPEKWVTGNPGWMHTSYDNSTSTETLNWVEIADLEDQMKVAALSIMRVQNAIMNWSVLFRHPSGDAIVGEKVEVFANITENESGVKNLTLFYSIDNGTSWTDVPMTYNLMTRLWNGTIPAQPSGTMVKFKIVAYDNAGNFAVNEGESTLYVYYVIPVVTATVDICPDALNLWSKGRWITGYIELPEGYDVADIDVSSIMLNNTVQAEACPTRIRDHDYDKVPDLMVKFDREEVIQYILSSAGSKKRFMTVTLTLTGKLANETEFQGTDRIKIITHPHQCHYCRFHHRCTKYGVQFDVHFFNRWANSHTTKTGCKHVCMPRVIVEKISFRNASGQTR